MSLLKKKKEEEEDNANSARIELKGASVSNLAGSTQEV